MKKILALVLLLLTTMHAGAVLNERNLAQSLAVLRVELKQAYMQQKQTMQRFQQMNEAQHIQMLNTMQKSSQVALMIYSQKEDYVFDLTYACHEATQMYLQFNKRRVPYDRIAKRMRSEVERYDSLITALELLPPAIRQSPAVLDSLEAPAMGVNPDSLQRFMLDEQGKADREECLLYAKALRNNFVRFTMQLDSDQESYKFLRSVLLASTNMRRSAIATCSKASSAILARTISKY